MGLILRRALLTLAIAAVALASGRALYRALASPEQKILWRLEEMVGGFNGMRAQPVLDGLAPRFVDRTSETSREDLRGLLAWMFLNEVDSQGNFLWSAALDPETISITVDSDATSAAVACRLQFFRARAAEPQLTWDARFAGELAYGDNGWQWVEVSEANHSERRLR